MRRGEWGNEKARAGNSGRWRGSGVEGWEVGDPPRSGDGGGGIWGDGGWRVGVRGGGYKRWGRGGWMNGEMGSFWSGVKNKCGFKDWVRFAYAGSTNNG